MNFKVKTMPKITMHFGASESVIIVDGVVFDRNQMTSSEFNRFRALIIQALTQLGLLERGEEPPQRRHRGTYWQRERRTERRRKYKRQSQHLQGVEVDHDTIH